MNAQATKGYIGVGMDGIIARWYAGITRNNMPDYKKDAAKIAQWIASGDAALDLAPGPGYLAIELAKLGNFKVSGLDISATFVEIAAANAAKAGVKVAFRQGDASAMPYKDETFNLIVCRAAFKNFSRPVAALDEMRRVLKPGGKAVIIDLRADASPEVVKQEVEKMGLNPFNEWMTKMAFNTMLLKRAYTRQSITEVVAESAFKTCKIDEDGLGLEVTLTK